MNGTPVMELAGVSCGYGRRRVLETIDLRIERGEWLCLLGPNGIGKTTLFKTALRLLPPLAGRIRITGEDTAGWPAVRYARAVGYVPQAHTPPFPFTVLEVVSLGRAAHLGPLAVPSGRDMEIARHCLDLLRIARLAGRPYTDISGGERQLVLIARALAQEPMLLIMDEPTSSLDFGNQLAVLGLIGELVRDRGKTVLMTSHDPNHALMHATRAAALTRDGRLLTGPAAAVVTPGYLMDTYGVRTRMIETGRAGGGLACVPC